MTKKEKKLLTVKTHVTIVKKSACVSIKWQLQSHSLTFIHKNKSLLPAASILSCSPKAYNTTASLDRLTCTDYVDFGKNQNRFERFSWSKSGSNHLDVKLKIFVEDDNKQIWLV